MRKNHKRKWHILCAVMALVLMISNIPILDVHAETDSGNPVITEQPSDSNGETLDDEGDKSGTDLDGKGDKKTTDPEKESDIKLDGAEKKKTEEEEVSEEPIVPKEEVEEQAEEQPVEVKAFLEAVDALWDSDSANKEELQGLIQAADDAYEALTEEQQAMEDVKVAVLTEEVRAYLDAVLALWDIEDAEEQAAALEKISELYDALTDEQKETVLVKAVQEALGLLDEIEPLVLGTTVYVSANGSDTDGDGTKENPFASLAVAVDKIDEEAEKAYTIELLSDLEATKCARINGKDITIKGNGHKITRGDDFAQIQDNARSTYNPAMIEVCNSDTEKTASLYLENITLDDREKTAGTKYSQASTESKGGNGDIVQDGIIATYDGVGTITLGKDVTLTGYGGMSAVRLSGGTLIMEEGSVITGGKNFTTKGDGFGPAGAVWIQGGTFTMEEGAKIDGVMGRAVYLDGGGSNATINGTITGIIPNAYMWNENGTVAHVRNYADLTLGESSIISDITGTDKGVVIDVTTNAKATLNGMIENCKKFRHILSVKYSIDMDATVLNGTIQNCTATTSDQGYIVCVEKANLKVGESGVISGCDSKISTVYAAAGAVIDHYGTIDSNMAVQCGGIHLYGNYSGERDIVVNMYDGAKITGNTVSGGFWGMSCRGGAVGSGGHSHGKNSIFNMYGGEISGNKASSGAVFVRKNGRFNMSGGTICHNHCSGVKVNGDSGMKNSYFNMTGGEISENDREGISYSASGENHVELERGKIFGNNKNRAQISITGGSAKDANERLYLGNDLLTEEKIVTVSFGTLTLDDNYSNLYLGNAMSAASNKIKELATVYKTDDNDTNEYGTKGSALWFKSTTDNFHFTVPQPSKYTINYALPLYVAYIPLNADGTPAADAELTVVRVNNTATVDVNLKNLTVDQPYALMWMQQSEKFGTFTIEAETPVINEVLGQSDYAIDYKISYRLTKDIASLVQPGDTFTAVIELDPQLSYYKDGENDSLQLGANNAFELASTAPKLTRSSDGSRWIMEVELKVKDSFVADSKTKEYPVNLTFKAAAHITNADFKDDILKTSGYMKGSVVLSGETTPTAFKLETPVSADTELKALPTHTITYTGGSVTVKEGTVLSSNLTGGTLGTTLPGTVTEDITIADPTRGGYTFAGWTVTNGIATGNIPSVIFTAQWTANPTTGGGGGTTPVTTPPAPEVVPIAAPAVPLAAPAVVAATPAAPEVEEPAVEVEDEEVPLAAPEEPEEEEEAPLVEMEEPEVPLASGAQWALLNLLLMILTVIGGVVMAIGATRKKEEYDEDNEESRKNSRLLHLFGIVPAIVSAIVFFLTEDMRSPMVFVDKMTVTMICITVVEAAAIVLAYRARFAAKNEQE